RIKRRNSKISILFTAQFNAWGNIRDPITKRNRKGHSMLDIVIRNLIEIRSDLQHISVYPFGISFFKRLKTAIEMSHSQSVGFFKPLEYYFSWDILIQVIKARRHFIKIWKSLCTSKFAREIFTYQGVNILNQFRDYFEYYYKMYLPMMVLYYELSLRVLDIEKPKLVIMIHEYGGFERALIFASLLKKIPVLALQHGIISKYHPGYMYLRDEISQDGAVSFQYVPIPTKTAVYGPYYQWLLTQLSSYPKSAVVVTGAPRYDILKFADKIYSKAVFCNKYGLDINKKIALIATQPFPIEDIRTCFLVEVLNALKKIESVQIVVKPHPREDQAWHKQKLKDIGVDAIVLPPKSDTYEAIYACDLFISATSTTILEAMILNKPVVVVNLFNLPEVLPWVEEGAALGVYSADKLFQTIKMALFDKNVQIKLAERRKKFVYEHVYKIDGKATKRVIDVIEQLLRKSNEHS
ncbi:MAG: UDP-N-acetylglucosamine 2-epimerase, partial [Candidatus Odinarchaeota archaeon]|nr:UDP-N-acetylglucosamine 2-epimerase [Candidatus Odinarchaeota archaeon]